jgi:hypothetical protein
MLGDLSEIMSIQPEEVKAPEEAKVSEDDSLINNIPIVDHN